MELVQSILMKLRRLAAPGGVVSFFEYVAVRKAKAMVTPREDRERFGALAGFAFMGFGRSGPFLAGALVMLATLLLALRLPGRRSARARV